MPEEEIRWHYRFRNFSRALRRLQDALEEGAEALNELEQEGVIQRFEYTFELAWQTLKDRLEHDGIVLNAVTPRAVIRRAYRANLISQGEQWINMLSAVTICLTSMTAIRSTPSSRRSKRPISIGWTSCMSG